MAPHAESAAAGAPIATTAERPARAWRWAPATLRGRTLLTIAALVLVLMAVLALPLRFLLLASFARLEEREARNDVARALNAVEDDAASLLRITRDYAVWDDTYAYMHSPAMAFVDVNFVETTFTLNRLSLVALVGNSGEVLFSRGYDVERGALAAPPRELAAMEGPLRAILHAPGSQSGASGLVLLEDGPMLVAAHPVLTSAAQGPTRGTLVMGRALGPTELRRLEAATRLSLRAFRLDAPSLPDDFARVRDALRPEANIAVLALDEHAMAGYGLLEDVSGAPALVVRLALTRDIWAQGRNATLSLVLSLLVAGVVIAIALLFALERAVLARLATLSREVTTIGAKGDLSRRVSVRGGDELAQLGTSVNGMLDSIERLHRLLGEEQAKSERLLLNVLPPSIAQRLKRNEETIADSFAEVSVLFADVVDFTRFASEVPPEELVRLLNGIFSSFDALAARHGIEKIKTIGDAYLVVAGLPEPRPDHARAAAEMALGMLEALEAFNAREGTQFRLRIGIHTGPVVAGVIGRSKFIYDIWGDTVNMASRMESHGLTGAIQVSDATRAQLGDAFALESRGTIHVKGKGDTRAWLLVDRRKAA